MQKEMKTLQSAKREHAKMLRNQSQYESQIKTLRNEVTDMKRVKVCFCFNFLRVVVIVLYQLEVKLLMH